MIRLMTLLIISLSLTACQAPEVRPFRRCVIVLPQENITGKCRCHMYEVTPDNVGRISDSIDLPLEYCDRGVVIPLGDDTEDDKPWWARVFADLSQLMEWIRDQRDNNQQ